MPIRPILFIIGGAVSFGVLSTIVKLAYGDGFTTGEVLGSQVFTGWCMLLAGRLLLLRRGLPWRSWLRLLAVGTFSTLTGWFYYSALQTIPASVAIVLLFQFSWIGVLLEAAVTRRWPSRSKAAAIPVLIAGTLLAGGIGAGALEWSTGLLYGLLSAVSFTLFIFFSGRTEPEHHPLQRAFAMTTGGMLLAFVLFPPAFLADGTYLSGGLWRFGVPLGFFGMVLPNLLFAAGMPKIGPGLGSILSSAELPTAVLLSRLVLGETVHPLQWLGVALILGGIALPQAAFTSHRQRRPAAPTLPRTG
ncbi:EamA family transporter [Gorillibacterium sp. sgz5001074]|uniref:EamA family transporter n=1 Tax=Gorillibacterium sp. sgz5001074 TaxID=3446695 RepID=UPI003F665CAE